MKLIPLLSLTFLAACTSPTMREEPTDLLSDVLPLRQAPAAEVVAALESEFPDAPQALADARTNSVIVQGTAAEVASMRELVARLDQAADAAK